MAVYVKINTKVINVSLHAIGRYIQRSNIVDWTKDKKEITTAIMEAKANQFILPKNPRTEATILLLGNNTHLVLNIKEEKTDVITYVNREENWYAE